MKKFLTLFLVSLLLFCPLALTGCGNSSSSNTASTQINFTERTFSCIDKLTALDYAAFYQCFDKSLQKEISQAEVQKVLDKNKQERHIRGGMATKNKYSQLRSQINK